MSMTEYDDSNTFGLKRVASAAGEARPERVVTVQGAVLPLYPAPMAMLGAAPWVEAAPFYDIVGLAEGNRADFMERNGLAGPDAVNIVRAPHGRVATLAPLAAGRVIDIARKAGAITGELASALTAALDVDGRTSHRGQRGPS